MANWTDPSPTRPDVLISRGTFFPKISSAQFCAEYRPPSELPLDTIISHLRQALVTVGLQLDKWRLQQPVATMAEVPAETITEERDGKSSTRSELLSLFERAVFCEAKAEILKETLTADRRAAAENNAKTGELTEDKYREFSADSISLILTGERIYVGSI